MSKLRIDVAYCEELKRVVDIQEACTEFFAQNEHEKFNFFCSDPTCRSSMQGGVRVTAVNHHRLPEENEKVFKSPHYRKLDPHISTCEWMELDRALTEEGEDISNPFQVDEQEIEEERKRRKAHRKLTKLVTKFIVPDVGSGEEKVNSEAVTELARIRSFSDGNSRRKALAAYARNQGATATSLESLVTCYEELRLEKMLDLNLIVVGHGKTRFSSLFRHVSHALPDDGFHILHGGARVQKRYGKKGFALRFMDKLGDKQLTLYVSPTEVSNYRPANRMVRIVEQLEKEKEKTPYLHVYWIGEIEQSDKGWSATFGSLARVVLRVVYPDKSKAQFQSQAVPDLEDE